MHASVVVATIFLGVTCGPVAAAPAATKAECQAHCGNQIAACNQQCSEFGSSERECRRDVRRLCRRSGVSACYTAQHLRPCGYSGPFPPPPEASCGGTCPEGLTCTTFRDPLHNGPDCFCLPVSEWRISCGIGDERFPFCGGPCPAGFQCKGRGTPRGNVCVCLPDALANG